MLGNPRSYGTDGRGSGGTVDPLASQGSLTLSTDGAWLFAVNAGSSSVIGFRFNNGKLVRIYNSLRFLSGNTVASGSVAFSAGFSRNDVAVVSETGPGGPNLSAISSYSVRSNGALTPISSSVPTLGSAANCWNVVTPDGRFVYASNAGSGSVSGFAIGNGGTITPLPGTVLAINPTGSSNIDITISADGIFLYTLNAGTGAVGMFAIQPTNGALTDLGTAGSLPAASGLNGIAAN
jgi:6-phosphogluconolactonase